MVTLEPIARLAAQFSRLPGIGSKSALRLAYHAVDMDDVDVRALADAILDAKARVRCCEVCGGYTEEPVCDICKNPERTDAVICVVADPRDALAMERTHGFTGRYHVLHGVLSPMDGVGPDDIRIPDLIKRVKDGGVKEVIIATDPDIEGEATAGYISRALKPYGVSVTRIAHGVPIGGSLEYIDEMTLTKALEGRREM